MKTFLSDLSQEDIIYLSNKYEFSNGDINIIFDKLSPELIEKFKDKIDWEKISRKPLSEDFIRKYQHKVNWVAISQCHSMSEDFAREFKQKLFMGYIPNSCNFSEEFIGEFKDKLDWHHITVS